jgi:hypothetical protein
MFEPPYTGGQTVIPAEIRAGVYWRAQPLVLALREKTIIFSLQFAGEHHADARRPYRLDDPAVANSPVK